MRTTPIPETSVQISQRKGFSRKGTKFLSNHKRFIFIWESMQVRSWILGMLYHFRHFSILKKVWAQCVLLYIILPWEWNLSMLTSNVLWAKAVVNWVYSAGCNFHGWQVAPLWHFSGSPPVATSHAPPQVPVWPARVLCASSGAPAAATAWPPHGGHRHHCHPLENWAFWQLF